MMPAMARFDPPSPKANISPPITMEIKLRPRAMGPVNWVVNSLTTFTQGELPVVVVVVPWAKIMSPADQKSENGSQKRALWWGLRRVIGGPPRSVQRDAVEVSEKVRYLYRYAG